MNELQHAIAWFAAGFLSRAMLSFVGRVLDAKGKTIVATYYEGQEIRWRQDTTARTWKVGFVVGQRNSWIIVRLPNGSEAEVHPRNVKAVED